MDSNSPLATLLNTNMRSHEIKENGDFISLSPLQSDETDGAMDAFQEFAEFVLKYDGHGYEVIKTHTSSARGLHDYDLILVQRTDRKPTSGT